MLSCSLHLDPNDPSSGYAVLAVLIGGACGAVLRSLTASLLANLPSPVPIPTLIVNAVGSFLIGLTASLLARSSTSSFAFYRDLLVTGVYGGLTTFSTLCLESVVLYEEAVAQAKDEAGAAGEAERTRRQRGRWTGCWKGGANLMLHNSLCIGLVYFGLAIPSGFSTAVAPI